MTKRLASTLLAILFIAAPAFAEPQAMTSRAFQFRFKAAEKAAVIIKPLLSAEGSISIQGDSLVVTDQPEIVKKIAAVLDEYDAPPRPVKIDVSLVAASKTAGEGKVPDDLKELSTKLAGVFQFNTFERVGNRETTAKEGAAVAAPLDGGYRADFVIGELDPATGSVRLADFRVSRLQTEGPAKGTMVDIVKRSSLNLRLGHTLVLGSSKDPQSKRVLLLVIRADQ